MRYNQLTFASGLRFRSKNNNIETEERKYNDGRKEEKMKQKWILIATLFAIKWTMP